MNISQLQKLADLYGCHAKPRPRQTAILYSPSYGKSHLLSKDELATTNPQRDIVPLLENLSGKKATDLWIR